MEHRNRIAGLGAVALVIVLGGVALASRPARTTDDRSPAAASQAAAPEESEGDGLAHAADRLIESGIDVPDNFADLASRYGLGGAVRVVAWADETGRSVDYIGAMRDGDGSEGSAMGWGQIAEQLGVNPGIGSIMGNGGGHGRDTAPGQNKDDDAASGG